MSTIEFLYVIMIGGYLLIGNAVYNSTLISMNEARPHKNNDSTLLWVLLCLFWVFVVPVALVIQKKEEE